MHKALKADPRYAKAKLGGKDIYAGTIRGHLWQASPDKSSGHRFLILPGFTEFCEKYAHVAQKMIDKGHDCLIIDWPGQGRSGHLGTTPLMVHCERFAGHIKALEALMAAAGWQRGDVHILAHSMGGHLALLAADRLGRRVKTMALSAPMISPKPRPIAGIRLLGLLLGMMGRNQRYSPFTSVPSLESLQSYTPNVLTSDEAGYLWQTYWFHEMPELRRYGASVGWVREAYRSAVRYVANPGFLSDIKVPVLVMKAEWELVVSNSKISYAASHLPQADLVTIKGARHELFNERLEIDEVVWDHLSRFWDRQGLSG